MGAISKYAWNEPFTFKMLKQTPSLKNWTDWTPNLFVCVTRIPPFTRKFVYENSLYEL